MDKRSDLSDIESAEFRAMRLKRASPKPGGHDAYQQLRSLMMQRLEEYICRNQIALDDAAMRPLLLERLGELLLEERIVLTSTERGDLFEDILGEILSTGPQTDRDKPS